MSDAHSLLFLSCDIVGSTRFKQDVRTWQSTFLSFYRQFPQVLATLSSGIESLKFELWKPVGDELIFKVRVAHEKHVAEAVRLWLAAMNEYENELTKVNLALKGGAFIATFPSPDSESTVPRNPRVEGSDRDVAALNRSALDGHRNNDDYLFDFFGPSIDTGFRIMSSCDQRFFTLSVETTWALQRAAQDYSVPLGDLVYLGGKQFKGVWAGREYPLFAVDRHHDDAVNTALRTLEHRQVNLEEVGKVCWSCVDADKWPSALFLPQSGFEQFKVMPREPAFESEYASTGGEGQQGLEVRPPSDENDGPSLPDSPPLG